MIDSSKRIALIAGNRLGDGLILQLLSYNLYLNGSDPVFFNTPLLTLKDWFPWSNIRAHFPQEESLKHLSEFDLLIFQHPNRHAKEPLLPHQKKLILYGGPLYMKRRSLVDIYFDACQKEFKLSKRVRSNGIEIPKNLEHRKHKKRILIHPMSLCPEKNWPKEKFIQLGHRLLEMGYTPKFTMAPNEAKDWEDLKHFGLDRVLFPRLSDLASYLYESGYLIGNDSGLAHLASNIQIPAITLFIRPGVAKRWRPNFSKSYPILPWLHLPGPKLQERFWKQIVSVQCVLNHFKRVVKERELIS